MMSSCPGERILRLLGTDALGDSTYAAIEEHIEGCAECHDVLDRLAHRCTDPTFVLPGPRRSPHIPDFEIRAEVGRGAMGVVYLALQGSLGRPVALKVLPGAIGANALPVARRRWLREARAVSSIRHPNVVPLYDCGEADGWFFLVFEYIPGGSLKQRLTGPLPPRAAATLVETVARAVGYIHGCGLLHLDLKPSNILLDGEADAPWDRVVPRVSDFGLALFDEPDAAETSLAGPRGTPSYMAPEQVAATRAGIGPAADIHAMGAILYELMTGRPPFQGASTIETLDQVRGQEPVPPRRLNPRIPRDLETITLKCLEKEPSRRYPSAGALAEDLERWLGGHPISARPVSPLERGWRWCRRRPSVAALAIALTLTLCVGFLSVVVLWRHAESERIRAETNGLRAEEDFRTASDVLRQFVEFTTEYPLPKVFDDRSLIPLLQNTRGRLLDVVRKRPGSDAILRQLASVDLRLGNGLAQEGRWDEARVFLEGSFERLGELSRRVPLDHSVWVDYRSACWGCAQAADSQKQPEISLFYLQRAVAAAEAIAGRWPSGFALTELARMRSDLAAMLTRRGDRVAARELLQANVSAFTPRPDLPMDHAAIPAWCILAPIEMNRHRSRFEESGTDHPTMPTDKANSSNPLALAGSPAMEALPAPDWAGVVLDAMAAARDSERRFSEAEVALHFCRLWMRITAEDRNHGRLEDSRRNVERLVELGRALVTRYPDQAESFLVLGNGYLNRYKIAWKDLDYPAIERHITQAVEAARKAVALDPADQDARHFLSICQRRLDNFPKGQRQAASQVR